MNSTLILDGISLAVFLVLFFVLCVITIISCIGWLYESAQRTKAEKQKDSIMDEIRVNEICNRFKNNDYTGYMRELENRIKKERQNV